MYFPKNINKVDAKKLFRTLSLKLHPDKVGGSAKEFISMKNEYENLLKFNFSYTSKEATEETTSMDEFIKANEFIKDFNGVTVELTGVWLWLSGNTQPYKEIIKENGFKWSRNKLKWYKAPYTLKGKKRGTNFNKIKKLYGYQSTTINKTAIA